MANLIRHNLGYLTIDNKPSKEILSHHYASIYFTPSAESATYSSSYSESESGWRNLKLDLLHYVLRIHKTAIKSRDQVRILDVGCGEGFLLNYFWTKGYMVKGIDYSQTGIETHNPHLKNYFECGDVFDFLLNESNQKPYDIIILANVLEHVIDVVKLLNLVKNISSPKTLFMFRVPNDESLYQNFLFESGMIGKKYWISPPEHLNYFNNNSIIKLLTSTNFEILDSYSDFPVEWFIANKFSNYINNEIGSAAHAARLYIETQILASNKLEDSLGFFRSLFKIGHGRVLTVIGKRN